jgi:two-component system sensor histidine kinase TctE
LPYASLALLATGRRDRIFYRIAAPDGSLVTGYPDLAAPLPPATSSSPGFVDTHYLGAPVRAVALGRLVASADRPGVTVVVAQTRDERRALAAEIFANAFLPVLVVVLVAVGLIWFGVRRALAPLLTIERLVREREPGDLTPIAAPAPAEVCQLLDGLNRFMERLQATLGLMQSFLADAAHQIRTPLATLRAQADLAVEEDDPAALRSYVHKIHRNAALASQVTNQLLSHTMVSHRGQVAARKPVDLVALLRQVAQRAESGGLSPPIELDLRALAGDAIIRGDHIALREAFTNLLDNARNYAGDQYPVQIRLADEPAALVVEVADRGPGIPDADKERVLDRFTRGSAGKNVTGSGLGLAIVKAVADAHRARLTLLDRPAGGLIVRLSFPRPVVGRPPAAAALLAVAVVLVTSPACAATATHYPSPRPEAARLLIHAATDRPLMEPLLRDFQAMHAEVAIDFVDMQSGDVHASVVDAATPPDIAISSAIDLQVKLVNDGWIQPHRSAETTLVPAWANWRNEAYGFTLEPAALVYARQAFGAGEVPRSRSDLLRLLQAQPDRFRRRVATYDIALAGVGYLFATQDSLLANQFWRLAIAISEATARLFPTSAEILEAIEHGEVLVGYNVLGSYALARQQAGAPIGIVLPRDYTLWMSRVVVIPRAARSPATAKLFVDYLLSPRGQATVAATPGMHAWSRPAARPASRPRRPPAPSRSR